MVAKRRGRAARRLGTGRVAAKVPLFGRPRRHSKRALRARRGPVPRGGKIRIARTDPGAAHSICVGQSRTTASLRQGGRMTTPVVLDALPVENEDTSRLEAAARLLEQALQAGRADA